MVAHNCHGKTKSLTAKTKYLTAKPKTSRQNQILHSKSKIALVLPWVFAFAFGYLVFAVKYLVLPWGSLFLPWGFWFCREVFWFCREVFGFAVRFSVLPWSFWFCRDGCGPPSFLPPGKNLVLSSRNIGQMNYQPLAVRSALPSILSVILYCWYWSTTSSGFPSLLFVQVGLARIVG